jgi:hypothetical protein
MADKAKKNKPAVVRKAEADSKMILTITVGEKSFSEELANKSFNEIKKAVKSMFKKL